VPIRVRASRGHGVVWRAGDQPILQEGAQHEARTGVAGGDDLLDDRFLVGEAGITQSGDEAGQIGAGELGRGGRPGRGDRTGSGIGRCDPGNGSRWGRGRRILRGPFLGTDRGGKENDAGEQRGDTPPLPADPGESCVHAYFVPEQTLVLVL